MIKEWQELLASVAVLKHKAYNYHWNVKGVNFMQYHKLTEKLYEGLIEFFDEIAEKIAMMGNHPLGTMQDYINHSIIKEINEKTFSCEEVVEGLTKDLETLFSFVTKMEASPETQPLLDEVIMFFHKQLWFFKSSK